MSWGTDNDPVTSWLLATLSDVEKLARSAAEDNDGRWWVVHRINYDLDDQRTDFVLPYPVEDLQADCRNGVCWCARVEGQGITIYDEGGHSEVDAALIAMHDPAAVLAGVEADRALLALGGTSATDHGAAYDLWLTAIRLAASRWQHMPGYLDEWRHQ